MSDAAENRDLPIANVDVLNETCTGMIDWIAEIEMPEERVGLREASGNIGGMLVGLLTSKSISYYAEESANVVELAEHLVKIADTDERRAVLQAILSGASVAKDKGEDFTVTYA